MKKPHSVLVAGLRASLLVLAVLSAHWLLRSRLPSLWRHALWLPVLVAPASAGAAPVAVPDELAGGAAAGG